MTLLEALETVIDVASQHWDEGPTDEGWQSPKLRTAIRIVEGVVEDCKQNKVVPNLLSSRNGGTIC